MGMGAQPQTIKSNNAAWGRYTLGVQMALCTVPIMQQQEAQESALLSSSSLPPGGAAYLIMSGQ